uniref:Uncharacterized protein n=1 Tax=Anguilla anguilla TaxID=7936 RepID=A0A0E9Q7I7_ANGAN
MLHFHSVICNNTVHVDFFILMSPSIARKGAVVLFTTLR